MWKPACRQAGVKMVQSSNTLRPLRILSALCVQKELQELDAKHAKYRKVRREFTYPRLDALLVHLLQRGKG
jgi:hypothetical protein